MTYGTNRSYPDPDDRVTHETPRSPRAHATPPRVTPHAPKPAARTPPHPTAAAPDPPPSPTTAQTVYLQHRPCTVCAVGERSVRAVLHGGPCAAGRRLRARAGVGLAAVVGRAVLGVPAVIGAARWAALDAVVAGR